MLMCREEEVRFWASFGYVDDLMVYCSLCKAAIKGMTSHE